MLKTKARALEYYRWPGIFHPFKTRNLKQYHLPMDRSEDIKKTKVFSPPSHLLSSLIWPLQKLDGFGKWQWIIKTGGGSNCSCCSRFCFCYGANQHSLSTWYAANELACFFLCVIQHRPPEAVWVEGRNMSLSYSGPCQFFPSHHPAWSESDSLIISQDLMTNELTEEEVAKRLHIPHT